MNASKPERKQRRLRCNQAHFLACHVPASKPERKQRRLRCNQAHFLACHIPAALASMAICRGSPQDGLI